MAFIILFQYTQKQESSPEKNKNVSNQNEFFDDQKINKDVQNNILQINLAQNIFDKFQSNQQGQLELENSQEINNDNECENSKSININPSQNQNYIQLNVNQREQILQQENIQQQVIHNKICEIGKGKFGNVIQIIDFQDKNFPFYARKTFYKFEDYMQEKQNYIEIDYSTIEQVQNFLMKMTQFNDEEKYFHQKLGYCSLIEFAKMRRKHNIIWRKNEIYYLFYRLADFLDFKFDQSSCNKNIKISQDQKCAISYGDFPNQLKPQNVIITDKYLIQQPLMHSHQSMQQELQGNIQDRILQLKIIDFGGASSELSNKMLTPLYFNSFKRKVLANQEVVFKDEEERFKGEIYSILRTFLKVCISSSYQKYVDVQFIFKTSTEIIQKMQIVANDDAQQKLYDSNDIQNILKQEKNININVDEQQNTKFQDKQQFAETQKDIDIKDKQQIHGQKSKIFKPIVFSKDI
ncbi:Protein kinase-like domain [Pseudocohnilembus persalinus]|uniref:Protein kinase-like domain n=1 Tax=Pseudocohnilembus persalinus TaxID=266149 RepID=A0A0V0Q879_PSEPJ|nr:Protein kinase-like domain [Pseudocohnilembus persalinus]|eukprot:KRW98472.1 Protein kinase-like domain [Pseudocohnilembus persalinus]